MTLTLWTPTPSRARIAQCLPSRLCFLRLNTWLVSSSHPMGSPCLWPSQKPSSAQASPGGLANVTVMIFLPLQETSGLLGTALPLPAAALEVQAVFPCSPSPFHVISITQSNPKSRLRLSSPRQMPLNLMLSADFISEFL